jgi:hypothetical protein
MREGLAEKLSRVLMFDGRFASEFFEIFAKSVEIGVDGIEPLVDGIEPF